MHVGRSPEGQARTRRKVHSRGLLGDLPIVGPIVQDVTGILTGGGGNQNPPPQPPSQPPAQPPAQPPSQPPSSPPSNPPDTGGTGGGGGAASGGGGDQSSGSNGGGAVAGGSSGASSGGSQGGTGGTNGGGSSGVANVAPVPGGSPTVAGTTASTAVPGNVNVVANGSAVPLVSQAGGGIAPSNGIVGSTTGADGIVRPIATGTAAANANAPRPTSTVHGSNGSHGSSTGGLNSDGSPASPTDPSSRNSLSKGGHLSGGAIAGIVLPILALVTLIIVFFFCRRSRARRSQSSSWWPFRATGTIRDDDASSNRSAFLRRGSRDSGSSEDREKRITARSSFGTTFDHGQLEASLGNNVAPTLPPMIEISRPSLGSVSRALPNNESDYRGTGDSSPPPTPMSVRPFSPTERFSFPKPPGDRGSDTTSQKPKSSGSVQTTFPENISSPIPGTSMPAINPFSDVHVIATAIPESSESLENETSFALETVRRPFMPSLEDELSVLPGNTVRVLKAFDDGWCFCELVKGKGEGSKGLIPIDCLREAGEELPSFLASKRVSSNYGVWESVGVPIRASGNAL